MASSSSTTWLRNTSATDRATLIAGSGRPRVSRPTKLRALMTRASSLPARPESTLYPMVVTSLLAIQLGGLRRSLVRFNGATHADFQWHRLRYFQRAAKTPQRVGERASGGDQ